MSRGDTIHEFWFGALDLHGGVEAGRAERWTSVDPEFDRRIRGHFEADLRTAAAGRRIRWEREPRSALALVLLFDQFPRFMYRGTPRAFMFDESARRTMYQAVGLGLEKQLWPLEQAFLFMPLQHAEDADLQDESVERFTALVEQAHPDQREQLRTFLRRAEDHREVIRTFGRFPHRNAILERESTAAEQAFLERGGSAGAQ
jgi:uncharacterized protein (DUF924 family)